jgi:hypothetical protein
MSWEMFAEKGFIIIIFELIKLQPTIKSLCKKVATAFA